jgi:hypothetical protein
MLDWDDIKKELDLATSGLPQIRQEGRNVKYCNKIIKENTEIANRNIIKANSIIDFYQQLYQNDDAI